jgi:hypothetical protein
LDAAEEAGFELVLTTDRRIRYQQNLQVRRIAFVVLTGSTKWSLIRQHTTASLSPLLAPPRQLLRSRHPIRAEAVSELTRRIAVAGEREARSAALVAAIRFLFAGGRFGFGHPK